MLKVLVSYMGQNNYLNPMSCLLNSQQLELYKGTHLMHPFGKKVKFYVQCVQQNGEKTSFLFQLLRQSKHF